METTEFYYPESPVVFEPEHHTYTLNDKQLSGVTAIVKWLFPDTYVYNLDGRLRIADSLGLHSICKNSHHPKSVYLLPHQLDRHILGIVHNGSHYPI